MAFVTALRNRRPPTAGAVGVTIAHAPIKGGKKAPDGTVCDPVSAILTLAHHSATRFFFARRPHTRHTLTQNRVHQTARRFPQPSHFITLPPESALPGRALRDVRL